MVIEVMLLTLYHGGNIWVMLVSLMSEEKKLNETFLEAMEINGVMLDTRSV